MRPFMAPRSLGAAVVRSRPGLLNSVRADHEIVVSGRAIAEPDRDATSGVAALGAGVF
jgi:hypothetical protein